MKRDLLQESTNWKYHPLRKPLILRGARQVGKSWLVNEFGKTFSSFIKIDFDKDKKAKPLFANHSKVSDLVIDLEIYTSRKSFPGKLCYFLMKFRSVLKP